MRSLVTHSRSYRFRLVANGCPKREQQILQRQCEQHDRLEFAVVSDRRPLAHGQALTQLQQLEETDWFAFMDSDIFATGDFEGQLESMRAGRRCFFSCPPVCGNQQQETLPPGYQVLSGNYSRMHDGFPLGTSYFSIYDNQMLNELFADTGLSLNLYRWDQVPAPIQDELRLTGRALWLYDTAKLLNIVLGLRGELCHTARLTSLCHIGGISCAAGRRRRSWPLRSLPRWVSSGSLRTVGRWMGLCDDWRRHVSTEERRWQEIKIRRRAACDYLFAVVAHRTGIAPCPPPFQHEYADLVEEVRHAEWLLSEFVYRFDRATSAADFQPQLRPAFY